MSFQHWHRPLSVVSTFVSSAFKAFETPLLPSPKMRVILCQSCTSKHCRPLTVMHCNGLVFSLARTWH